MISKKIGYIISTNSSHEFYCVKSDYTKLHEISYFFGCNRNTLEKRCISRTLLLRCFSYTRMYIQGGTSKRDMKRECPYSVLHDGGGSASQSGTSELGCIRFELGPRSLSNLFRPSMSLA